MRKGMLLATAALLLNSAVLAEEQIGVCDSVSGACCNGPISQNPPCDPVGPGASIVQSTTCSFLHRKCLLPDDSCITVNAACYDDLGCIDECGDPAAVEDNSEIVVDGDLSPLFELSFIGLALAR